MNNSDLHLTKDKTVNDNNWSCLVVLLIETNPNSMSGIDLFEKYARLSKRTDIQNITPQDLEIMFPKEKMASKEESQTEIIKSGHKRPNKPDKLSPSMLQALLLKKYILEYKVNDLAKRAEKIRYLLINEIILSDSDSFILEPDNGAFCYFVLTKFYDPLLINNLLEMNVPLVAVFEFKVEAEYNRKSNIANAEERKRRLESIDNFWDQFIEQLNDPENMDYFSKFLFLPIEISSEQWSDKKRGEIILEHILLKLLSINKIMRKYIHYIDSIEIIDAPTIFTLENVDIYNKLMDSIPLECVTIELIIHCMVEQVVAHFEDDHSKPYSENLEYVFEENEMKFPLLFINHRDKIRRMTFNLKINNQLNHNFISTKKYSLMPYATIWNYYPPQKEVEKALNGNHVKKLLTCVNEKIAEDKFLILLHLISFNKLLCIATHSQSLKINKVTYDQQLLNFLSILDKEENNKIMKDDPISGQLHSDTPTKRKIHLNSLRNFLECNEFDSLISYDFLNDLHHFCYTEDLPKDTLLQILNKSYLNFLHNDHYYCPLTDKLLVWFHNFCDENGLYSRVQKGLLNAKIGFGDFYTYPDNETQEWLSNQNKEISLVDDALKKSYISRNFSDINPLTFVLNPSIKVKIPFPKKECMNKKLGKDPFTKVYNSFGLGRISVSEQTDVFFSVDGPSLTFKKTKWLRKNGHITIILNSHQHLLTLHQSLLNLYAPPIYDPNQDIVFNIHSDKGIIVSSRMKAYKENTLLPLESENKNEVHYETLITLPNGLIIELFRGKYNFIKQTFSDKSHLKDNDLRQEDYRIFLKNGTVIIFMNDGSILILYYNSTQARIKLIGKKPSKYLFTEVKNPQELKMYDSVLEENEEMAYEIIRHEIIGWNGRFLRFNKDEVILSTQLYELKAAFCSTRGLFTSRSDGTKCYVDHDGILTIYFPDKTITTVIPTIETVILDSIGLNVPLIAEIRDKSDEEPFEIIDNRYIMDHPYYMKVEFVSEQWIVHLPFGGLITATREGFELAFDKYTDINFNNGQITVISKNKLDESKNTLTNIFLQGEVPFEYTICSVQGSDGKVFDVRNTGDTSLTIVQQTGGSEQEESIESQQDQIEPIKNKKSHDSLKKPSSNSLLSFHKKINTLYATKHFTNQILLYTKTDLQIENDSNLKSATTNPMNKFSNTKERQRFFVLNRDLSGYELINEYDMKPTLKKYETNFKVFQPFLPCTTATDDIITCQMPLTKTWNQLFWTACCNSRLCNTNLKKNELLNIPTNQKWLCTSTILTPPQNIIIGYDNKPITDNIGLKHPAMLIRRIKNVTTNFNVFKMFKLAIKKLNKSNCEILYKYEKQLLPDKKLQSDIDKSEMIFKNAMEELMQSDVTIPTITLLPKGDTISTPCSSAASMRIDESEDSDETDSQMNPSDSLS